jgi:general stress protein 26
MEKETERFILEMFASHPILTLATNREDGWPQANTVSYVNEGLSLYVITSPRTNKVRNIERDPRVALTVCSTEQEWRKIKGLSMAAMAEILTEPDEIDHAAQLMLEKFPHLAETMSSNAREVTVLRLTPKVISVLNYEKGFGNSELIEV